MSLWQEFGQFIKRGNVVDLTVGFTVGAAFTALVKSFVEDVLMPPIGFVLGRVDFSNLFVVLREGAKQPGPYATLQAARDAGAVTWRYGLFLNALVSFLIVAVVVFVVVRLLNRVLVREKPAPPAAPTTALCPYCRMEISLQATRCPYCTSEITHES